MLLLSALLQKEEEFYSAMVEKTSCGVLWGTSGVWVYS